MIDPVLLLAALLTGLAGAGHCAGMCGGIAGALAHAVPLDSPHRVSRIVSYGIGRVGSYMALGGTVGATAALLTPGDTASLMLVTRLLAALALLAVGVYLLGLTASLRWLEAWGSRLWKRLSPLARRVIPVTSHPRALALGMLWGLLPCGLVYGALLYAATSGSAGQGALVMLAFGIGTLPATLGLGLAAAWLARHAAGLRRVSGLLLTGYALLSLVATLLARDAILDGTCRSPGDVWQFALQAF